MRRIIVIVATFALVPVTAAQASAKPSSLQLRSALGPLQTGAPVDMAAESWTIETSIGTITCSGGEEAGGLLGSDQSNGAKTDKISVTEAQGAYARTSCAGAINGGATSVVENGILPAIESGVQGTFGVSANGKAEYKAAGKGKSMLVAFSKYSYCTWELSKLKGKLGTLPGPLQLTFSKQKLKVYKEDSDGTCPKNATYTITFGGWLMPSGESEAELLEGEL